MKIVYFYDTKTGSISSQPLRLTCSNHEEVIALNTPAGHLPVPHDVTDPLSQRVDQNSGKLVDYQPPQPDDDHEWDEVRRRWQRRAEVVEREERRAEAQAGIDALEKRQARRVREILAESDPQMKALNDEAAALRAVLNETGTNAR